MSRTSPQILVLSDSHIQVLLEKIPYVDDPELRVDKHESTEMPFRYVIGEDGLPIMPEVGLASRETLPITN